MEQKKSEFNKVLNAWDVLVIAFGAMIGWGWVVSTGGWIEKGGVLGAAIGFVIGGIMIFFVGMTYAELTAAMPQCGGEHVFSYKAMGSTGSFICTWMIILGYVSVACFEACAFPTIITYLWPGFLKGYLYTVAGFDIYASWLIVAIVVAFLIMMINIIGAKTAAILQTVLTCIIGGAGILLIIASVINGTVDNLDGQMFAGSSAGLNVKAIIGVAALSPFYFIGFDVIPQAAEEINVPAKKIGSILILSVVLAVVFYALVIVAVGLVMGPQAIVDSEQATGLVTADAMAAAFNTKIMAKVIIVGGMVLDWGVHLLDQILYMYGDRKIETVYASLTNITNQEVDDGFTAILTFEGGTEVLVEVGTNNYISLPRWYVLGKDGTAVIRDWQLTGEIIRKTGKTEETVRYYCKRGFTKGVRRYR